MMTLQGALSDDALTPGPNANFLALKGHVLKALPQSTSVGPTFQAELHHSVGGNGLLLLPGLINSVVVGIHC